MQICKYARRKKICITGFISSTKQQHQICLIKNQFRPFCVCVGGGSVCVKHNIRNTLKAIICSTSSMIKLCSDDVIREEKKHTRISKV